MSDVEKIKTKLFNISLEGNYKQEYYTQESVENILVRLDSTGKWLDVNYLDKTNSRWLPVEHWTRILKLLLEYRNCHSEYFNNIDVKKAILSAMRWWIKEKPVSTNYWWNAVGIPILMGESFILMEKELDDSLKVQGVELMKVGVRPTYYEFSGPAMGQNLLWIASAHLYASCIMNDLSGIKRAFDAVANEVVITEKEGIQPDFSYYQHGPQNYAFGYGKGFSTTAVRFFYLAQHTMFQFPEEKIEIISHFLLDGQQWMTRYSYLEYTAMGREISRKTIDRNNLLTALNWMKEIDPQRNDEYDAFHQRLSDNRAVSPLIGNRYFWRSDLMIHQRKNYYFSLKGTSNRILNGESGNGENIKGFYQGNGTYYLIRSGKEYHEILPVWDWRKLPGLLCAQKVGPIPLFDFGRNPDARGNTSFVYGINDNMYGCFAYDYNKEGVKARRSWFLFDNEIVHLANSIEGDSLYQSINQCKLNGNIWSNKSKNNTNEQMIFHDSVGYCINYNNFKVVRSCDKQNGNWKSINLSANAESVSENIFSLGINLGTKVTEGSFYYAIVPGISLKEFKKYRLSDHIEILKNNNVIQAVYHKNIQQVQAIFFDRGLLKLPWNNLSIKMMKPGLVILKKNNDKLIIDYSQPFPKIHLEINLSDLIPFMNDAIEISNFK